MQVAVGQGVLPEHLPQGGVGNVHAKAAEGIVLVQLFAQTVKQIVVDEQMSERAEGDGLSLLQGGIQFRHHRFGLRRGLFLDMAGIQRFQQLGG